MGKGKGSQTNTQQNQNVQYSPYGLQNLQNIYNSAAVAASQPFRPYEGNMVANWNDPQSDALRGFRQAANQAGSDSPYLRRGARMMENGRQFGNQYTRQGINMIDQASNPIGANQIQRYQDPYNNQVIDATLANINQQDTAQQQQLMGNATLRGSLGGDRSAVMQAELARTQDLARNQTIGNLRSQGYSQALNAALAEQQAQMAGGYQIGALGQSQGAQSANIGQGYANLGATATQNELSANQALLAAGTAKQQNRQAELNSQYQQYQQMMAYPYQQAQFMAQIGLPATSAMGGYQTQIGETGQTYTPPFWNLNTGGAVPYAKGGNVKPGKGGQQQQQQQQQQQVQYTPPQQIGAMDHYSVAPPNGGRQLPFNAGDPIYLPGQTIQPYSQLIGPNGLFYAGQNPSTTPNQGQIYNAVGVNNMRDPEQMREYMRKNWDSGLRYDSTAGQAMPNGKYGKGSQGHYDDNGNYIDPESITPRDYRQIYRAIFGTDPNGGGGGGGGGNTQRADGGTVPMPWEIPPPSLTGNSPYPGIGGGGGGGGGMPSLPMQDSKPSPMPMSMPSPPKQESRSLTQGLGDISKLYQAGKKVGDWMKPTPTAGEPLDISANAFNSAASNPSTAVGSQFIEGQAATSPGLAAGAATEAAGAGAGAAGAEALGGIGGASAALGEAGAAAAAETAGLGAIGSAAAGTAAEAAAASAGGFEALTALLALLHTGGRVYADGGAIEDGEADRAPTVPETHETLSAQQNQLIRGNRRVQMFPSGTPELPLPSGMARAETPFDIFHYNPSRISEEQIVNMAKSGRENELLDLGPFNKTDIINRARAGEKPVAVVERDHRGREVKTAAGTEKTAQQQMAIFAKTRTPGNVIGVEDPRKVLSERISAVRSKANRKFALGGEIEEDPIFSGNIDIPGYATDDLKENEDRTGFVSRETNTLRAGKEPLLHEPDPYATAESNNQAYPSVTPKESRAIPHSPTPPKGNNGEPPYAPHVLLRENVIKPASKFLDDNVLNVPATAVPDPTIEKPTPDNFGDRFGSNWPAPQDRSGDLPMPKPRPAATEDVSAKTTAIPMPKARPAFPTVGGDEGDPDTVAQRRASAEGISGDDPRMARAVTSDNSRNGGLMGKIFGRSPYPAMVAARMKERGYSDAAIAATIAHGQRESGWNPNARGDKGSAFGFFQWRGDRTPGSRSPSGQIDHFLNELETSESAAGKALRNAKTPEEANAAMAQYERFKGHNDPNSREYMARLNLTRSTLGLDPANMTPSEIMDRRNFQGVERKGVGKMISDPDFWLRTLVNAGASDFTHGTGPMLFSGLSKSIGSYDQFSKDDLSAQQKGQELAEKLYRDSQTKYQAINYTDESGRLAAGAFDPRTGRTSDSAGNPVAPGTFAGKPGSSGKTSVFEQKRQAYLTINPGDERGALDYASGSKRMSPQEIRVKSIAAAQKMIANMPVPPKDPVAETNRLAAEIEKRLAGGFEEKKEAAVEVAAGKPADGKDGSTAETALPDPGDGKRVKDKWYIAPDGKPRQWKG